MLTNSASTMSSKTNSRQEKLEDILASAQHAMVLLATWEIGVFARLHHGPAKLGVLSADLKVSSVKLGQFLDAICQLGLLQRSQDVYSLVPGDEALFAPGSLLSSSFSSATLETRFSKMAHATEVVRSGVPLLAAGSGGDVPPDDRHRFLAYLHDRSVDVANEVATHLAGPSPLNLLDLGCGAGTYGLAVLAKIPTAHATFVDRDAAWPAVEALAIASGALNRIRFEAIDIAIGLPDGMYDLVILSNLIHCYSAAWNQSLLHRIVKQLSPDGRIAIKDYAIDENYCTPQSAVWFRVSMAMYANEGDVYPSSVVGSWLAAVGLQIITQVELREDRESYLLVAQRS